MSGVTSTSFLKFENMNDYIKGLTSFIEVLDEWQAKADAGYERKYDVVRHDEEFKLEIELTVTPH